MGHDMDWQAFSLSISYCPEILWSWNCVSINHLVAAQQYFQCKEGQYRQSTQSCNRISSLTLPGPSFKLESLLHTERLAACKWMGEHHASPETFQLWYFAGALWSESVKADLTGHSCCPAVRILREVKSSKSKARHTSHQALESGDQAWKLIPRTLFLYYLFPQYEQRTSS